MADTELLSRTLSRALALLRQAFDELESMNVLAMTTLDELPEPKRRHAALLVGTVRRQQNIVEVLLTRAAANPDAPITTASPNLMGFYESERSGRLKQLPKVPDDLLFENFMEDIDAYIEVQKVEIPESSEGRTLTSVFDLALDSVETSVECGIFDEDDAIDTSQNIKALRWMMDEKILAFDEWLGRLHALRAVVSKKSPDKIPRRVHQRLLEVYRSFVYGNWLSTIAMSRALLEYAILERGPSLSLAAYVTKSGEKKEPKKLSKLVELLSGRMENLRDDLEIIVSYGNDVMHPKKKGNTEAFPPGEVQAADCVERLRRVLTALYSA